MDKNQPAKAKDMGLIPGPERSHMPHRATEPVCHNYSACALEPTHHYGGARMLQLLQPMRLEPVLCNEKPLQREACTLQPEKDQAQQQRPSAAKNKLIKCLVVFFLMEEEKRQ